MRNSPSVCLCLPLSLYLLLPIFRRDFSGGEEQKGRGDGKGRKGGEGNRGKRDEGQGWEGKGWGGSSV